jgi:hypothetical protein
MTKIKFYWGKKSDRNMHGTQKKGEPWNKEMVTGPKFSLVKLGVHKPTTGHRLIFYWPSGAWNHLDVVFDRRASALREGSDKA